jgi:hypothetical protein
VGRIAGQEHPARAVLLGQPGGVREAGYPARCMDAEVGAGVGPQLRPELLQGGRDRAVLGHGGRRHHGAVQPVAGRADAEPPVGLADLVHHLSQLVRRRGHLHLAVDPFVGGRVSGEADAELPAHQAAPAVAADQPA